MAGKERKVYFSGSIIPESEARISIYDSALMFGDMVFEMTRSFNKVQFKTAGPSRAAVHLDQVRPHPPRDDDG